MPHIRPTLHALAMLLCVIAGGSGAAAFAQTTAQPAPTPTPADSRARLVEIDASIPNDPAVDQMLKAYTPKVRALDIVIGRLKGDLRKGGAGSGSMGNFVSDGIRVESSQKLGKPILLAVTNSGGLRKSVIAEGELRQRDIFELLPFENALVAFDLTGSQVLDLLRIVVSKRDVQSGARIKYRTNADKKLQLESARLLIDGVEQEIDPAAIYTVISIDYLLNVAGGDYGVVLKEAKNIRPLDLTIRDAISDYVKQETAAGREIKSTLDGRFVFDKEGSGGMEEPND